MLNKTCTGCGAELEVGPTTFYRNRKSSDGFTSKCKPCVDALNKKYRENNREKYRESRNKHYNKNHKKYRELHYLRKYNITLQDFEALFSLQGGACAICGTTDYSERMVYAKLVVDHCHITGSVRGLLCKSCNIGLGEFKDDASILLAAVEYLNDRN